MNIDLLALQAVIVGGAILLVVVWHNKRQDKARRKREAAIELERQTGAASNNKDHI